MSVLAKRSRYGDAKALASRLKHRVTIEQRVRTVDDAGGASETWNEVATVWAEFRSRRTGDEREFGGKLEAAISHEIVMRYRAGITANMRIAYDNRYFNIRRIINVDEAGVILELLLEEGVAN